MTARLLFPIAALMVVLALTAVKCDAAYGAAGHGREHRYARQVFGNDSTEQGCLAAL